MPYLLSNPDNQQHSLNLLSLSTTFMKSIRLFALLFFANLLAAEAQPPVLNSNYFPVLGKAFSGRNFFRNQPWPVATGANVTWDFTPLQANYITDYNFAFRNKPTTGTQGSPLFPGAEMTQMSFFGEDSIENFLRTNGGQLLKMGYKYKGWDGNEIFNPNRVEFQSNLDFGDVHITQINSVKNIVGTPPQYFKYYDTLAYAGYGTMITTFATYQNVPLVTRKFATWYSNELNGNYSLHQLGRHWYWYLPTFGAPYISYTEEVYMLAPEQVYYDGYIGFIPQVSNSELAENLKLNVFPTQIQNLPTLYVTGLRDGIESEYSITDMIGRTLQSGSVKNQQIDVAQLPKGIFQLQVWQQNQSLQTRIVKE